MHNNNNNNFSLPLPLQLLFVIGFVFFFGSYFNETIIRIFYTFSLFFKLLLSCILPPLVFSFVAMGILSFNESAPLVLAVLIASIFASNTFVAFLSYLVVLMTVPSSICNTGMQQIFATSRVLYPMIEVSTPLWISSLSLYAVVFATLTGLILPFISSKFIETRLEQLKKFIGQVMRRVIIPFLPLYIFGFLLKMQYENALGYLFEHYGIVCLIIVVYQFIYIFASYYIISGFSFRLFCTYIDNVIPSYITAFGTMSSVAAIPVSIIAAKKNTQNNALASVAIPIMANIHLVGDCISVPFLTCATLLIFKGCLPSFLLYALFVPYFCTVMFGAAGIPGGGIIVMIPLLKTHFGFTEDMIAIIMSLYLVLDPFGTAANVTNDGVLVILVNNFLKKLKIQ